MFWVVISALSSLSISNPDQLRSGYGRLEINRSAKWRQEIAEGKTLRNRNYKE